MPTEPNAELLADERVPTALLAGRRWPMPPLSVDQNVTVMPLVLRLRPKLLPKLIALQSIDKDDTERLAAATLEMFTPEILGDMVSAVYGALRKGHPELTREEFGTWEVDLLREILPAYLLVQKQSGMFKEGPAQGNGAPSGERRPKRSSRTGAA